MQLITRRDALIVAAIFLIGAALLIIPKMLSGGSYAEIRIGGEVVRTVSLSDEITFSEGNVSFEVKDGKIRVVSSPCRDKICEHTGFISLPSETIVCLPERISVNIVGGTDDIDLIVG